MNRWEFWYYKVMMSEGFERASEYALFITIGLFALFFLLRPVYLSISKSLRSPEEMPSSMARQMGQVAAYLILLFLVFVAFTTGVTRYDVSEQTLNALARQQLIEQTTLVEFTARKRERAHEGYKINGLVGLTESRSVVRGGNISDLFSIGRFNREQSSTYFD